MKLKAIASSFLVFTTLAFWGCSVKSDVKVIKLGHGLDASHPVHIAMEYMSEELVKNSNGKMRIDIYPSQQLGTERECVELLQIGSLGMTKVSASILEGFASSYTIFNLPYIFRDEADLFSILDGEIGREILKSSEKKLIRGVCYYDAGSRSFYTKAKPINSPKDLDGMKIRTQESATSVKLVNSLGGSATPISWGELYTALQQGVVDGAENNPPSFYLSKHYEVCKYYSLDEHTAVPDVLIISTKIWNSLNEEEQGWFQAAVDSSVIYQRKIWKEATNEALKKVAESGVEIIYPDKKPFSKKVESLYDEYKISDPGLYKLIFEIKSK